MAGKVGAGGVNVVLIPSIPGIGPAIVGPFGNVERSAELERGLGPTGPPGSPPGGIAGGTTRTPKIEQDLVHRSAKRGIRRIAISGPRDSRKLRRRILYQ